MLKRINQLIEDLRIFGKTPEIFSLLMLLGLWAALIVLNIFFLPLFLKILSALIFLSIAFTILINQLKLARLKIEIKLKTGELQTIIEGMNDGVIVYDTSFKILAVNRAAEEITGLTAKEIVGQKMNPGFINKERFRAITQILFPTLAPAARQISSEAWPQIVDLSLEDPLLKLRTTLNRVLDENNKMIGFLKIIKDETREQNILESKNEFVTITSHQLRTPLTAINWTFEHLLKNLSDKPELQEIVKEGLKLGNQAVKTVNDLLDVTKIERGRFGYKFEPIDLTELIREILNQAGPIAKERQIKLLFDAPQEKTIVNIDSQRLGLAITNLIDNAIKYNRRGGEVAVFLEKLKNQPFLKINVSDTGAGIPPEELDKLFTKFYRGSNVIQLEPNGSGLGLYITKNIIERHGGKIGVVSNPDRGSTFYFTLPTDRKLIPQQEIVGSRNET